MKDPDAQYPRVQPHFLKILENLPEAILISNKQGRILFVNSQGEKLFGYPHDELLGMSLESLLPERFRQVHVENRLRYFSKPNVRPMGTGLDLYGLRKDASEFPVDVSLSPLESEDGVLVTSLIRDITDRKRLEQQLRQVQKMQALGQLSGGVAHDFNNLLGVMIGSNEYLLERLGPDDAMRKAAERIQAACQSAAALTRQLLAFSRQQVLEPRVLDLNGAVEGAEKLLQRVIDEDIQMATDLDANLGAVKADPGQIEQILMNLVVNARDAMPKGGKLTISTANVEVDETFVQRYPYPVLPGPYVKLEVTDTGCGMDKETLSHIFEPFFTTKEIGKGTGLGLATVYGIVKQSGGYIWVSSEPGAGATFSVYLPRANEPIDVGRPGQAGPEDLRGSETILLVEDTVFLREVIREMLETSGYTVLEATSGSDAVTLAEQHKDLIELLLTDVVMPGMSALDIAHQVVHFHAETKVLYMSGYVENSVAGRGILVAGTAFLQKPFTPEELLRKVRSVLGARRPGRPADSKNAESAG